MGDKKAAPTPAHPAVLNDWDGIVQVLIPCSRQWARVRAPLGKVLFPADVLALQQCLQDEPGV